MRTYKTVQGDTWDMVSYRAYGDEGHVGELIAANLEHVNAVLFSAGIALRIPEVAKQSVVDTLPPWRREA